MRVSHVTLFLVLAAALAEASAESVVNLLVENDAFTGTDRHYTSGVMLNYVSGINEGPRRLQKMGIRFPGIEEDDRMHVALSLGHEIYTPTDIAASELLEDDRPYAGHIYVAAGFTTENHREIESWRLSVGLVGPGARAEIVQNKLHRKIGSPEAQGWEHQLENEAVISVAYEKKWLRLARSKTFNNKLEIDFLPHASGALGTPLTYLGGGGMVRIGRGLDWDYGPPRVRPSLPVSQYYEHKGGVSWYLFAGVDARYIAHNLFLDGNNFRDSHSVDREPFVGDLQAGAVWNNRRFRLAYSWIYRTREFKKQEEADIFGSLSLSVHF
jgi:hypothetical protein